MWVPRNLSLKGIWLGVSNVDILHRTIAISHHLKSSVLPLLMGLWEQEGLTPDCSKNAERRLQPGDESCCLKVKPWLKTTLKSTSNAVDDTKERKEI